jgi:hypothetical protein
MDLLRLKTKIGIYTKAWFVVISSFVVTQSYSEKPQKTAE